MSVDVTRDAPPTPLPPIDPAVRIPDSVKAATEKANSFYTPTPEPAPSAPAPEPSVTVTENLSGTVPETPPAPAAPPPPPASSGETPVPTKEELGSDTWAQRYNSMHGRWKAAQSTIAGLQETVTQLGDELMRTQDLVRGRPNEPAPQEQQRLVTPADEETYGTEFLDVAARVARDAVAPQLHELQAENARLQQHVAKTTKETLKQTLTQRLPNWQEIDKSPRFKAWLRLPDVYSGEIRGKLWSKAVRAADAPRVAKFYEGFLAEERATGHLPVEAPQEQPQAPRQAALQMAALAAPGRERPASGQATAPAEKPIISRQYIADFYRAVRQGHYRGREAQKVADEQAIYLAQNEGRVR